MLGLTNNASVQAASDAVSEAQELVITTMTQKPEMSTRVVELGEGRTFIRLLTDADVSFEDAQAASTALGKIYDHRKLKAGQEVSLDLTRSGADRQSLTRVSFAPEPTKEITLSRSTDNTFNAVILDTPLVRKHFAVRGKIHGSLYATGEREGVPSSVMASLVRAYAHKIDFQRDIKQGDEIEVLYDQPTAKDGAPVGQGEILYAALITKGTIYPLYRVTLGEGAADYFDERGQSIRSALLRTPIDGARMTSGYGMRMHPVLGYSKMHKGADFGAPMGTPILAAGSGVVVEARHNGSYGRYILLRNSNNIETAYAHMSRFAREIYPGARVNQGDVIGFVGATGRTTGPNLHFEVRQNGHQINPLELKLPSGRILSGELLTKFKKGQERIKREFDTHLEQGAGSHSLESST